MSLREDIALIDIYYMYRKTYKLSPELEALVIELYKTMDNDNIKMAIEMMKSQGEFSDE